MTELLKLRAEDAEDLAIVSAYLQDAVLPIGEMCFLPDEHQFVMVVNRFRWETDPTLAEGEAALVERMARKPAETGDEGPVYERVHCALRFDGIDRVKSRGIDLHDRSRILDLLAIEQVEDGLALHFAGGSGIKLEGRDWTLFVEDRGEPWPTRTHPNHVIEDMLGQNGSKPADRPDGAGSGPKR